MRVQFDRWTLLLACFSLAMLVTLATEIISGMNTKTDPVVRVEVSEPPDTPASLPNYVPQSFDSFAEVLERPLFYAERQLPNEPTPQAVAAAPPEPLRLKLEGIAIMNESRIALLRGQGTNELVQMVEGMAHNGWTLESVLADKAIFTRGDDSTEIELETDTGSRRRP